MREVISAWINALLASNVREEQLKHLMAAYATSLLRMCCAYLEDASMAEDATQDTFIKAYQSAVILSPSFAPVVFAPLNSGW